MSENLELGPLFDRRGHFIGFDPDTLANLPPERVETYKAIEVVAKGLDETAATIKALQDDIAAHNHAANEWQRVLKSSRPTFMDEWKASKRTRAHDRGVS